MTVTSAGTGVAEEAVEEVQDGVEDAANPEDNADGSVQAGVENQDGAGEGGDPGEGGEETPEAGPEPEPEFVVSLREQNRQLQERLDKLEKGGEKPAPEYKEPTAEEQAAFQEKHGIPWATHKMQVGIVARGLAEVEKRLMGVINSKFGSSDRDNAINAMAKKPEYRDIHSHMEGIKKFLDENVDPSMHGNQKVLADALIWARGWGMSKKMKQIASQTQIGKKIVSKAKIVGGGKGSLVGKKAAPKLNKVQIEAWEKFGKPHGQTIEQYAENLSQMS